MEKGWKHKKSSNKNKFKVGDIVSYSDGVQKFEGKITGDFTDEKFYVGDKYGYQVSGFGDRLKPEQLTLVTKKMAKVDSKNVNKEKIGDEVYEFLKANGYELGTISEGASGEIIIEPSTRKTGDKRKDFFDGMQIIRFPDGTYEVSEYMAGPKEDEMYIYKETKSLKVALKDLIKGNKRKPIKKYAKGGGVKSSTNTYKLRAEGLNDFLAFLQKGMYFRVKSFTVETTSGPDVVISFTTDASLSEIKSKLDEVPDSHVMLETIKPINEYTGERNEEYEKGGGVSYRSKDIDKIKVGDIVQYAHSNSQYKAEVIDIDYDSQFKGLSSVTIKWLDNGKIEESYLEDLMLSKDKIMAKGGGVGSSSKLKYSLYLDRTVGDNVTTYHIADFAAKGDLSIALESLKEAAPKNYMYYTK